MDDTGLRIEDISKAMEDRRSEHVKQIREFSFRWFLDLMMIMIAQKQQQNQALLALKLFRCLFILFHRCLFYFIGVYNKDVYPCLYLKVSNQKSWQFDFHKDEVTNFAYVHKANTFFQSISI